MGKVATSSKMIVIFIVSIVFLSKCLPAKGALHRTGSPIPLIVGFNPEMSVVQTLVLQDSPLRPVCKQAVARKCYQRFRFFLWHPAKRRVRFDGWWCVA